MAFSTYKGKVDATLLVHCASHTPIIDRLRLASELLTVRMGGCEHEDADPTVVAATEIVHTVIKVLEQNPQAARLIWPDPPDKTPPTPGISGGPR